MPKFTIRAAKANLPHLLALVEAGDEVIIVRGEVPVARLVSFAVKPRRKAGSMKGQFEVPDSFFEPLPPEELKAWGEV